MSLALWGFLILIEMLIQLHTVPWIRAVPFIFPSLFCSWNWEYFFFLNVQSGSVCSGKRTADGSGFLGPAGMADPDIQN